MRKVFIKLLVSCLLSAAFLFAFTACGNSPQNAKTPTGINFKTLTVDGDNVYGTVSNATTEFKFAEEIEKSNCIFVVSKDAFGSETYASQTIPLEEGDNVCYIFVSQDGNLLASYTVTVHRAKMLQIRIRANGGIFDNGTTEKWQNAEEGSILSAISSPQRVGYTFVGWDFDFSKPVSEDVTTISAIWCKLTLQKNLAEAGSISSLDKTYSVGEEITITATTNYGYFWLGWYDGENLISIEQSFTFNLSDVNVTYTAKWTYYTVITLRNKTAAGSVNFGVSTIKPVGEEVTVVATINAGYTFAGWYCGDEIVSSNLEYTFTMPEENVEYTACWYKVTLSKNKAGAGSVTTLNGKYFSGEQITVVANTNNGYSFVGWFIGDTLITEDAEFTFNMPTEDLIYTAKWCRINVSINDRSAGEVIEPAGGYILGEEVTISTIGNEGYTFIGWFEGDTLLTEDAEFTFVVGNTDRNIVAKWEAYTVLTNKNITMAGTVSHNSAIKVVAGEEVTVSALTNEGFRFVGWYEGSKLISSDASYSFFMPNKNVVLTAGWTDLDGDIPSHIDTSLTILDMSSQDETDMVIGLNVEGTASEATATYLESFEGAQGVAKIDYNTSIWPAFSFKTPQDLSEYEGYKYIAIKMYVTSEKCMYYVKLPNVANVAVLPINPEIVVDGWKEYIFPAAPFLAYWSQANEDGNYLYARVWMMSDNTPGSLYIDYIKMMNVSEEIILAGEIANFSSPTIVSRAVMKYSTDTSYVTDAPVGASHGSVKFTIESSYYAPVFYLTPQKDMESYKNFDTIRLTLRFNSSSLNYVKLYFWTNNSETYTVKTNEWVTLQVSFAEFLNNFESSGAVTEKYWFTFVNEGSNKVNAVYVHEIIATTSEPTSGGALVLMDETAVNQIVAQEDYTSAWTTDDYEEIVKPEDVGGMLVLSKVSATENNGKFNICVKNPDSNYSEFHACDIIVIRIYVSEEAQICYRNFEIATLPANEWTVVNMPKYVYTETEMSSAVYSTDLHMFEKLSEGFVTLKFAQGKTITCAIAEMSFKNEEADISLGDKYAEINVDTLTAFRDETATAIPCTVTEGLYFGKQAVRISYNSSNWLNIYVKPGKTYRELSNYSRIKVEVYVEGATKAIEFYNQAKLYGETVHNFYFFTPTITSGSWQTFTFETSRVQEMWASLSLNKRALIIDRNVPYTAIYIASIICE